MTENVWFVGISKNDYEDITDKEAKDAMAFIGGKVISAHDNGTYDVELPKCLHDVMEFNGWFSITFDIGDDFYEINASA